MVSRSTSQPQLKQLSLAKEFVEGMKVQAKDHLSHVSVETLVVSERDPYNGLLLIPIKLGSISPPI